MRCKEREMNQGGEWEKQSYVNGNITFRGIFPSQAHHTHTTTTTIDLASCQFTGQLPPSALDCSLASGPPPSSLFFLLSSSHLSPFRPPCATAKEPPHPALTSPAIPLPLLPPTQPRHQQVVWEYPLNLLVRKCKHKVEWEEVLFLVRIDRVQQGVL